MFSSCVLFHFKVVKVRMEFNLLTSRRICSALSPEPLKKDKRKQKYFQKNSEPHWDTHLCASVVIVWKWWKHSFRPACHFLAPCNLFWGLRSWDERNAGHKMRSKRENSCTVRQVKAPPKVNVANFAIKMRKCSFALTNDKITLA